MLGRPSRSRVGDGVAERSSNSSGVVAACNDDDASGSIEALGRHLGAQRLCRNERRISLLLERHVVGAWYEVGRQEEAVLRGYGALWALDREAEKRMFETFVDTVMDGLARDPNMHIYHYAPYEPSALKRLMGRQKAACARRATASALPSGGSSDQGPGRNRPATPKLDPPEMFATKDSLAVLHT